MADNIDVTPGAGKTIAADEIGSVLHQRVKLEFGGDGTATEVSSATPLPIAGGMAPDTAIIKNGTTDLTPKFAAISSTGNGDTLALVASKKIRVLSMFLVVAGATTVKFQTGGVTDLTGAMSFGANGGISLPFNPVGWFETTAGAKLNHVLGSSVGIAGGFTYIEV